MFNSSLTRFIQKRIGKTLILVGQYPHPHAGPPPNSTRP